MTKTPALILVTLGLLQCIPFARATPPRVGDSAPNFTLKTLDDRAVQLTPLAEKSRVVLIVLRGWPGYQCPICTRQVKDFVNHAADFRGAGAQVLMVYPGPAAQLHAHAQEFLADKNWPADFLLVIDPDYALTNAYELRWNAKNETAYPSTFVVERGGRISYAHTSRSHGDRVGAEQALAALRAGMVN